MRTSLPIPAFARAPDRATPPRRQIPHHFVLGPNMQTKLDWLHASYPTAKIALITTISWSEA